MLTACEAVTVEPEFSEWKTLVGPSKGEVFGKNISAWQHEFRLANNLPLDTPILMVGHQPTFFHPGILAKFIAAARLAKQVDGVVVFLVVDHHIGTAGTIETCKDSGHLSIQREDIADVDASIAMQDQPRVYTYGVEPFASALAKAQGENAAMQFANAIVECMKPYATVDFVLPGSALLASSFGKAMLEDMFTHSDACIHAYNAAVEHYPEVGISVLGETELPLWQGASNEKFNMGDEENRPRALTLTLLARLLSCDLFIHGSGGYAYDNCMEMWCREWLRVEPSSKVMASATLRLPLHFQSWAEARREYFSPQFGSETKEKYLRAIEESPYGSPQRKVHFQKMRRWLDSIQEFLDKDAYMEDARIAAKREWAFPLYSTEQLHNLVSEMNTL